MFRKKLRGDDSIALIQFAYEQGLDNCIVVYCDTGWAHPDWPERVKKGEALADRYGFVTRTVSSHKDFAEWVLYKNIFPTGQLQWCTSYLKIFPFAEFADRIDPKNKAIIVLGKRRAESAQRKTTQEFETSELYDRKLWNPLYKHTDKQRNKQANNQSRFCTLAPQVDGVLSVCQR